MASEILILLKYSEGLPERWFLAEFVTTLINAMVRNRYRVHE
jgi:hypothetical protein